MMLALLGVIDPGPGTASRHALAMTTALHLLMG